MSTSQSHPLKIVITKAVGERTMRALEQERSVSVGILALGDMG